MPLLFAPTAHGPRGSHPRPDNAFLAILRCPPPRYRAAPVARPFLVPFFPAEASGRWLAPRFAPAVPFVPSGGDIMFGAALSLLASPSLTSPDPCHQDLSLASRPERSRYPVIPHVGMSACRHVGMSACRHVKIDGPIRYTVSNRANPEHHLPHATGPTPRPPYILKRLHWPPLLPCLHVEASGHRAIPWPNLLRLGFCHLGPWPIPPLAF